MDEGLTVLTLKGGRARITADLTANNKSNQMQKLKRDRYFNPLLGANCEIVICNQSIDLYV